MAQNMELKCSTYKEARVTIAGADVSKGDFATYNDLNGFYIADAEIGDKAALIYSAEKVLFAKTAALAINAGDKVYRNAGTGLATKTATDVYVGVCVESALAADSHVLIDFDGTGQADLALIAALDARVTALEGA